MTPMCDDTTFAQVGWAVAVADCAGNVILTYYDTSGVSEGSALPADWRPCVQGEPGPEWTPTHTDVPYAASVNIDFAGPEYISIDDVTGNLTFTGSNYTSARHVRIRVVETGASSRTLTFPGTWVFVGPKPVTIAANKTGLLDLISFGGSSSSVVANWEVQT